MRGATAAPVVRTDCEEVPLAPGGGDDSIEVCYIVWREYWTYDLITRRYTMVARWPLSVECYQS
jgi:hypothetical protein